MEPRKEYSCVKRTKLAFQTALARLAKDRPLNKITVKALCEEAGLSRNAFYFHYTDIDALITEIEEDFFAVIDSKLIEFERIGYPDNVLAILQQVAALLFADRDIALMLLDGQRAAIFVPRLNQVFCDFSYQYFHGFHPNSSRVAYDYFFTFLGEGFYGMLRRYLLSGDPFPYERVVDLSFTLIKRLFQLEKPSLDYLERPLDSRRQI
ncbi:MAG: TetR/AcrR family transcriptional regulator [Clostridia bacterium]|nr:TetR/AcrR family transcriptional regulator [Clostridia bacterium]MBR3552172.1 TetR/AcrR family transcriptional regulator [Clostridia bacterium]